MPDDFAATLISGFKLPSDKVPVKTKKLLLIPLWVTGIPARAGTEIELDMPGTTDTLIPKASTCSISS